MCWQDTLLADIVLSAQTYFQIVIVKLNAVLTSWLVAQELAHRELDAMHQRVAIVVFLRLLTQNKQEVSGYIDFLDRQAASIIPILNI